MEWKILVANFINVVVVLGIVQLIKLYWPSIRQKMGWMLPLFSVIIGPLIALAQNQIAAWLGFKIDLSPITTALFTGLSSVGVHQFFHQLEKSRTGNA